MLIAIFWRATWRSLIGGGESVCSFDFRCTTLYNSYVSKTSFTKKNTGTGYWERDLGFVALAGRGERVVMEMHISCGGWYIYLIKSFLVLLLFPLSYISGGGNPGTTIGLCCRKGLLGKLHTCSWIWGREVLGRLGCEMLLVHGCRFGKESRSCFAIPLCCLARLLLDWNCWPVCHCHGKWRDKWTAVARSMGESSMMCWRRREENQSAGSRVGGCI